MSTTDIALFYVPSAVLALPALLLGISALWRSGSRRRRRCPKCWYDMSSTEWRSEGVTCPECGRTIRRERSLHRRRIRWRRLALASAMLGVSGALALGPDLRDGTWPRRVPTSVLIELTPYIDVDSDQFDLSNIPRHDVHRLLLQELCSRMTAILSNDERRDRMLGLTLDRLERRLARRDGWKTAGSFVLTYAAMTHESRMVPDSVWSDQNRERFARLQLDHALQHHREHWAEGVRPVLSINKAQNWSITSEFMMEVAFLDAPAGWERQPGAVNSIYEFGAGTVKWPFTLPWSNIDGHIGLFADHPLRVPPPTIRDGLLRVRLTLRNPDDREARSWTRHIDLPLTVNDSSTDVLEPANPPGSAERIKALVEQSLTINGFYGQAGPAGTVWVEGLEAGAIREALRGTADNNTYIAASLRLTILEDGKEIVSASLHRWSNWSYVKRWGRYFSGASWPRLLAGSESRGWTIRIEGDPETALYEPSATHYWSGSVEIPLSSIRFVEDF